MHQHVLYMQSPNGTGQSHRLPLTLSCSGRSAGTGGGGGSFSGAGSVGEGSGFTSALPDMPLDTEVAPTRHYKFL